MTDFNNRVNFTAGDKSGVATIIAAANAAKGMKDEVSKARSATATLNDAMAELAHQNKLAAIARDAAKYAAETGNARAAQLKLNAELTKFGATANEIRNAARAYDREFTKAVKDATRATERQRQEQDRLNDSFNRIDQLNSDTRRRSGLYGDIDTSIGAVRGLVDSASPGAGAGLTVIQDIFAAKEAIDNLKAPMQFLRENAGKAAIGLLSLGGAALAIAALGFAIAQLQAAFAAAAKAAKEVTERQLANAQAQREINDLLSEGQFEAVQKRAQDALKEQTNLQADLANLERRRAELQTQYDQADLVGKAGLRQQIDDVTAQIAEKGGEVQSAIEQTAVAFTALDSSLGQSAKTAEQYTKAVADFVQADTERKQAAEQTAAAVAALTAQEDELRSALEARRAEQQAALELQRQRDAEDATRNKARSDRDREIAESRAAEDLNKQLEAQAQAHKNNLLTIEKRAADAIIAARQALADREAQAFKQIADAQAAYQQKQAEDLRKFQADQKRALEDFQRDEQRARQDYRRSQLENLINNDVTAAILDEQSFKTDRRRGRQDFRTDRGRQREDFDTEQQKAFEALQERIAGIQQELEAFRVATAEKIIQIEAQKIADLEAAQFAFEEKLRLDQEARDLQAEREKADRARQLLDDIEDRNIKMQRDAADRATIQEREDAALNEQLGRIQTQKDAQIAALDTLILKTEELRQKALALSFGGAGAPVPLPSSSKTPYVPTPGSDAFYEKPRPLPGSNTGGLGGVQFAGASSLGGMSRGARSEGGGGQTIVVNIDGKPAGSSYKPLVDAIVMGVREAIYNPQVGTTP